MKNKVRKLRDIGTATCLPLIIETLKKENLEFLSITYHPSDQLIIVTIINPKSISGGEPSTMRFKRREKSWYYADELTTYYRRNFYDTL